MEHEHSHKSLQQLQSTLEVEVHKAVKKNNLLIVCVVERFILLNSIE